MLGKRYGGKVKMYQRSRVSFEYTGIHPEMVVYRLGLNKPNTDIPSA